MRTMRWGMIVAAGTLLGLTSALAATAAPPQQTEPPVRVELTVAQTEVTVGAPLTWRIALAFHETGRGGTVRLRPGDERAWAWPDLQPGDVLSVELTTGFVVLDVTAVPLVTGELHPTLEVQPEPLHGQTQLIVGDQAVHVQSVEGLVEAGVIAAQATVRQADSLPMEFWIRNSSPFLLEAEIRGRGTDLAWEESPTTIQVPAGSTRSQVLHAIVEGEHPQPQLVVQYAWTDACGTPHARSLDVSGESIAISQFTIVEPWHTIVGVLTGSVVTLIPAAVREWRTRQHQKKMNRQHVHGLLRLTTLQSKHAATNATNVDLGPLETVFEEEGLFAVLEEGKTASLARDLWTKAKSHNGGLTLPGGAQRSLELRRAAQQLEERLEKLGQDCSC